MPLTDSPEFIAQTKRAFRKQGDLAAAFASLTEFLEAEVAEIAAEQAAGQSPIPELSYTELAQGTVSDAQRAQVQKRGCVIIRGVFDAAETEAWNEQLVDYIEQNHYYERAQEKAGIDQYFSQLKADRPQVFGLYWSKPQMWARQAESMAQTKRWLNGLWQVEGPQGPIFDPPRECTYADRIRRREPGDNTLGLSPHVDSGSIERWLDPGFQQVYASLFSGDWQAYDPFNAAHRLDTEEVPSPAVCHMFRTFQGWTALTPQGPGDGTLQLVPSLMAIPWMLLRALQTDVPEGDLCGAQAGRALRVSEEYHALVLKGLVPIPRVFPGDTVWWHPDVVHAVEDEHQGSGYSNVMYIGASPHCPKNIAFQEQQKPAFLEGKSCPDFAPEDYEVAFTGRATLDDLSDLGRQQMGFVPW